MSDRVALIVGILISCIVLYDVFFRDSQEILFLARKGMDVIEWMAFWR